MVTSAFPEHYVSRVKSSISGQNHSYRTVNRTIVSIVPFRSPKDWTSYLQKPKDRVLAFATDERITWDFQVSIILL